MEFGEKLKSLREEKGMTQQTLADHLYVTRQAVSKWECGARFPDLMTTKKIADYLQVSIDELVSGDDWKDFAEKQPAIENETTGRLQTAYYTIAAILMIIKLYVKSPEILHEIISNITHYSGLSLVLDLTYSLCQILPDIAIAIILLYAANQSIKRNLGPKMIASIIGTYMGSQILFYSYICLYTKNANQLFIIIAQLLCLGSIMHFFKTKTQRNPLFVYIVCCIQILAAFGSDVYYTLIIYIKGSVNHYFLLQSAYCNLNTIAIACIMCLTMMQAKLVSQKRKLQAKKV